MFFAWGGRSPAYIGHSSYVPQGGTAAAGWDGHTKATIPIMHLEPINPHTLSLSEESKTNHICMFSFPTPPSITHTHPCPNTRHTIPPASPPHYLPIPSSPRKTITRINLSATMTSPPLPQTPTTNSTRGERETPIPQHSTTRHTPLHPSLPHLDPDCHRCRSHSSE